MFVTVRSHSGTVLEYDSFEAAILAFASDDGYRLSFQFPDGTDLHIRKGDYTQDHPALEDKNHFMYNLINRTFEAEARVQLIRPEAKDAEVIHLFN
jgi:hypothetical protein